MYTISDLADELNRQEWAVEKMLRNRGYLKQNGDPCKSTINDGLMDEDGMITDDGWTTFIDELGYKGSGNDGDEEDDTEEDYDDLDFMEDDGGDDEEDDIEEEDDDELPEICSMYHGWAIWVEKDKIHKYVVTAELQKKVYDEYDDYEIEVIDSIEIYGDEIGEGVDVESFVIDKIEKREEDRADIKDWNKNYGSYMGLDEDPGYWDS